MTPAEPDILRQRYGLAPDVVNILGLAEVPQGTVADLLAGPSLERTQALEVVVRAVSKFYLPLVPTKV